MTFAQAIYKQTGGSDQILTAADPIFGLAENKAACDADRSCTGKYYAFSYATDPASMISVVKKQWLFPGQTEQSVNVSYDVGASAYGYAFVPDGMWDKLDTDKFAAGVLLGITTGPSVNVVLAGRSDGQLNVAQADIATIPVGTISGTYGTIDLTAGVKGGITATLDLPDDITQQQWYKNKLTASYYWTPGMLLTFNTVNSSGFGFGFDSYGPTLDYADFASIQGLSISPSLTPYVELKWGLIVPASVPVINGKSLASIGIGYENPVAVNLDLAKGKDPSLTLVSKGDVTFSAGLLGDLTSSLTYKTTVPVYEVATDNLWPGATKV